MAKDKIVAVIECDSKDTIAILSGIKALNVDTKHITIEATNAEKKIGF